MTLGATLIGATLLLALFNFLIDPYHVFGNNTLGIYVAADRESKPAALRAFPHNALLMGTSKAAMIDTSQLDDYTFFSISFGAAQVEELYDFCLRYDTQPALAVLMLDLGMFGSTPPFKANAFAPRTPAAWLPYLLERTTTAHALKTLRRHYRGSEQTFRPDGSYIANQWAAHKNEPNPDALARTFENEVRAWEHFRFSEERYACLLRLRDLFRERGVRVVVVLHPLHERSVHILRHSSAQPLFEAWLVRLRQDFPDVVDLTDSHYSRPEHFFVADPVHYTPEAGVIFMNTLVLPRLRPSHEGSPLETPAP